MNELVKAPKQEITLTPQQMLSTLVQQGSDPAVLKDFMDLAERWEKNEAKKAYVLDMAKLKKETITILKTKAVGYKNKDGTFTGYKHATLDHILEVVVPVLSKHGFSHSWGYTQEQGFITVTCKITHKQGHSESTPLRGPEDKSGGKNAIQAIGSSSAYLERYTFLAIIGLAAKDQDDDGKTAEPVELLSKEQINKIHAMITDNGLDMTAFLKYKKIKSIEAIPVSAFKQTIESIKTVITKRASK